MWDCPYVCLYFWIKPCVTFLSVSFTPIGISQSRLNQIGWFVYDFWTVYLFLILSSSLFLDQIPSRFTKHFISSIRLCGYFDLYLYYFWCSMLFLFYYFSLHTTAWSWILVDIYYKWNKSLTIRPSYHFEDFEYPWMNIEQIFEKILYNEYYRSEYFSDPSWRVQTFDGPN